MPSVISSRLEVHNKRRLEVYNKYGGRCAYSGTPLEPDWQIDHFVSKRECWFLRKDPDEPNNLYPAQKIINHYKRALSLSLFKIFRMNDLHKKLAKLPKNPRTEKGLRRKEYMLKLASYFGITPDKPFSGVFYFEAFDKPMEGK